MTSTPRSRRVGWSAFLPGALLALLLPSPGGAAAGPAPGACAGRPTMLVVDTAAHTLLLCKDGASHGSYRVALGAGGTGKQREGDRKTPLGSYPLLPPRPSKQYHLFLLVGYPTDQQRARGFSGSAIGIHGPSRTTRAAGSFLNTLFDWTQGCIAVGSDEEIEQIAAWVRQEQPATVELR